MSQTTIPILEVIVAKNAGTCFGVEAAIEIAEKERKPILGPLVHNPQVIQDLAEQGIPILERYQSLEALQTNEVIITAHGYPKQLKQALSERGIRYYDATCPVLSKWVYRKIERFESDGYHIILIGNPNHAEIIASRSYGEKIYVVYSEEEIDALPPSLEKTVAICQTTITQEKFQGLVDYIRKTKYPNLRAIDTRCKPVKNQQIAVEELSQWVDVMFIIGGYNSSNTTNLARIASNYLPKNTYHIDSPEKINPEWLRGIRSLGLGAGTSTPTSQIEQVKQRVVELFEGEVRFRIDGDPNELLDVDFTEKDEM
jgi:4-hydroxy-3-methylbut-2-enyl diphosphate reductase